MALDKDAELMQRDERVQADIERKFDIAINKADDPAALQEVIDRLKEVNFDDTYLNIHNLLALPGELQPGEIINYATSGVDDQTQAAALVVVTNQRVILLDNRLIVRPKVISIDPTRLIRVKALRGFVLGTLSMRLKPAKLYRISSIYLPTLNPLLQAMQDLVNDDHDDDQAVNVKEKRIDD